MDGQSKQVYLIFLKKFNFFKPYNLTNYNR